MVGTDCSFCGRLWPYKYMAQNCELKDRNRKTQRELYERLDAEQQRLTAPIAILPEPTRALAADTIESDAEGEGDGARSVGGGVRREYN